MGMSLDDFSELVNRGADAVAWGEQYVSSDASALYHEILDLFNEESFMDLSNIRSISKMIDRLYDGDDSDLVEEVGADQASLISSVSHNINTMVELTAGWDEDIYEFKARCDNYDEDSDEYHACFDEQAEAAMESMKKLWNLYYGNEFLDVGGTFPDYMPEAYQIVDESYMIMGSRG